MPATRQSWANLQPLPAKHSQLAFERAFTQQEFEQISMGFIPDRMEDKWFIFLEEDQLYFYRSWTGYCIYQLHLNHTGSLHIVNEALVNRDQSQYSGTDDAYDERLLDFLIDSLLLNQPAALPISSNIPAGIAADLHLQHVVGAGPKAEPEPKVLTIRGMLGWLWSWLKWLVKR